MVLYGYAGKILRINLTKGKVSAFKIDYSLLRMFIGGTGLAP